MDKSSRYALSISQVRAVLEPEGNNISNLANVCAILKENFDFFWVGFYLIQGDVLMLGPFQGPVACTRIARGKGVCGKAWELEKSIVVDNVDKFPGHIACNAHSRSEIVIPIFNENDKIYGVLDIDDDQIARFDEVDRLNLEKLVEILQGEYE